jgi:diguanylate cyclase (GGDEF)-like protein/PAS domain S-box-containing protein
MDWNALLAAWVGLSAVLYVSLGVRVAVNRLDRRSYLIIPLILVIAIWVGTGAIEILSDDLLGFRIGRVGHYFGTAFTPLAAYLYFRAYTGSPLHARVLLALAIIPAVSVTLAATNDAHELMWRLPITNEAGHFLSRPVEFGSWFKAVHAPYSYGIVVMCVITLMRQTSAVTPVHRRGLTMLTAACVIPLLVSVAHNLGFGPATLPVVPIVFSMTLPFYAWVIFSQALVDFSPVAYETVFQNMHDPVIVLDAEDRIIGLNHGAEDMFAVSEKEALMSTLSQLAKGNMEQIRKALVSGEPQRIVTATGRFMHLRVSPIASANSPMKQGRVLMFRDVSDVERAQKEVMSSEMLLRTLVDHSANGILRLRWKEQPGGGSSSVLTCIFANKAAARFLRQEIDQLIGRAASELFCQLSSGGELNETQKIMNEFDTAAAAGRRIDLELKTRPGDEGSWVRLISEPVGDDVAVTLIDMSDRKARELRMESDALTDPLTSVHNRRGFLQNAARRLQLSDDNAQGALLFIDLNNFKEINDELGHDAGDAVLVEVANRLRSRLRPSDIIGRPGGDEFVALVPDLGEEEAEGLAIRLSESLAGPHEINGKDYFCPGSIGLALYPKNANTLTGLMRCADEAMYRAKSRCKDATAISERALLEKAI